MKQGFLKYTNLNKNNRYEIYSNLGNVLDNTIIVTRRGNISGTAITGKNTLSAEQLINGQVINLNDNATQIYIIPKIYNIFASGDSSPQLSKTKFFINNEVKINSLETYNDNNNQYILWKTTGSYQWVITNTGNTGVSNNLLKSGFVNNFSKPTGLFSGVSGFSGIITLFEIENKLNVLNTPGISGFAGSYTSGTYTIGGIPRIAFRNDNNINQIGGYFYIYKNTSPSEWRAVEELYNGPFTWYTNFDTNNYFPSVTGWTLADLVSPRLNPVPITNFNTCLGNIINYPEYVFTVKSLDSKLNNIKLYSGGFIDNSGYSTIFPQGKTIEDLFPFSFSNFKFNKQFFYSDYINGNRYGLFNVVSDKINWIFAQIPENYNTKFESWCSYPISIDNTTLKSAEQTFSPYEYSDLGNISIKSNNKYSKNNLFSNNSGLNLINYSGNLLLVSNNSKTFKGPIIVEGAGTESANGLYYISGNLNGKNRYIKNSLESDLTWDPSWGRWDLRTRVTGSGYSIYIPIYSLGRHNELLEPTGVYQDWYQQYSDSSNYAPIVVGDQFQLVKSTFGEPVPYSQALNADGTVLAIGNSDYAIYPLSERGRVDIYVQTGSNWNLKQSITGTPGDRIGWSLDMSDDGEIIYIGGYNTKMYVGNKNDGWSLRHSVPPLDPTNLQSFQNHVSTNNVGDTLVVGSRNARNFSGIVRLYEYSKYTNSFQLTQSITGTSSRDQLGWHTSISDDSLTLVVGGYFGGSGSARIYTRPAVNLGIGGYNFQFNQTIKDTGIQPISAFGSNSAITSDGGIIVVGGYKPYIYSGSRNYGWTQIGRIDQPLVTQERYISLVGGYNLSSIVIGGYNNVSIYTGKNNSWEVKQSFTQNPIIGFHPVVGGYNSTPRPSAPYAISKDSRILSIGGYGGNVIYNRDTKLSIPKITYVGQIPIPISISAEDLFKYEFDGLYEYKTVSTGNYSGSRYFESNNFIIASPNFGVSGANCNNTGIKVWSLLDKNNGNKLNLVNCNSGNTILPLALWNSGVSNLNFQSIDLYKYKTNFVQNASGIITDFLALNTGYNYSKISGIFNLSTGQSFVFDLEDNEKITGFLSYKASPFESWGLINNSIVTGIYSLFINSNYYFAYQSGNNINVHINFPNRNLYYSIYRTSGTNITFSKNILTPIVF